MTDCEKVIKGLECCQDCDGYVCRNCCPYHDKNEPENQSTCTCHLAHDALALLKAQEPIKPNLEFNLAGQYMWCCGNCGTTLFFKLRQMTDDEEKRNEHRFCHYCGQAVKWE